ncbi:YncE family protein, partial [candidate division WOR-3 bacterium]|nr:YncE family protein [candidate division WOR-3 bacterium]
MRRCVRGRGWLSGRLDSLQNLAVGPLLACALVLVGFSLCFGWTPPVPDTIILPDSLGPIRPPYHLAFGSSTDNIYVASETSDIIVVDGKTFQRIKRIYTNAGVGGALLVAEHNKLYCTYPSRGRIGIIDCVTNDTVGSIPVSTRPKLLCYSSGSDKLYCGDSVNRRVWVIDCAADTVRKVILTGSSPADMVYDPTANKVYVAAREGLLAISCVTDSVIANLDSINYARELCLNKRRRKLYVVGRQEKDDPDAIYVVSPQSDSVTAAMLWGWNIVPSLACNEATDRLYALTPNDGEFTREFDCLGDTFIRSAYTPRCEGDAIACDTVHNRLFHRSEARLLVLDCTTLDVVATIGTPAYDSRSDLLVLDPGRYRAVCPGQVLMMALMIVFDYKGDTVYSRGVAPLCGWAAEMYHNPATGRLYCHLGGGVTAVVDEQTNRMVKCVHGVGSGLVHSRTSNKLYYPIAYGPSYEYQGLGVVDGTTDSLIKIVGLGDWRWEPFPCWCPIGNKVYCFASKGARWFIAAVDCSTDSVVWERDMYDLGRWFRYLENGLMLCNHSDSLALIDPRTDSVLVDSSLAAGGIYAVTHTRDG